MPQRTARPPRAVLARIARDSASFRENKRKFSDGAWFFNEARIVNLISHPSLVTIHEYGALPDGSAYIVMEYLEGQTLAQRMKAHGAPLAVDYTLRIGRQVATALAAAHDKDVVHRDLKPDNLMIIPDLETVGGERIKVLDFGIAKVKKSLRALPGETRAGVAMGTPGYIAPEQIFSASSVDGRADVYSLGIILYEMLCGHRPFACASGDQEMKFHLTQRAPPLLERMPRTPPAIASLIHAMLVKEPQQRPTMREVLEHLRAFEFLTPSTQFMGQATAQPVPLRTMAGVALVAFLFAGLLLSVRLPSAAGPEKLAPAASRLVTAGCDAGAGDLARHPPASEKFDLGAAAADGGTTKSANNQTPAKARSPSAKPPVRSPLDEDSNVILK